MYHARYDQIQSKTACLALAFQLRKQAENLEYQAQMLDRTRNHIPIELEDFLPVKKVCKIMLKEPLFETKKNFYISQYANRFCVSEEQLRLVLDIEMQIKRRVSVDNTRRAVLMMYSKGKKQVTIARSLNITSRRVSQIISKHKKTMKP